MHTTVAFPTVSICISWILARAGRSTGKGLAIRQVVIIPDFGTSSAGPLRLHNLFCSRDAVGKHPSSRFNQPSLLAAVRSTAEAAAAAFRCRWSGMQLAVVSGAAAADEPRWLAAASAPGSPAQPHAWDPLHSRPSNAVAAETPRPKAQVIQCVDDASSGCLLHHQHIAGCDRQRIKLP